MAKDNAEEFEILMALRLSGEISSQDNQKLETFFQSNHSVKQAFERKEKAFKLLTQAVKNSPKLQLPLEKRQALLQLSFSKKSGKAILTTYTVAAVAFFSFMIGMYFYANKVLETPQKSMALKEADVSEESVASKLDSAKADTTNDLASGNELKKETRSAKPVPSDNVTKKVVGEYQDLTEREKNDSSAKDKISEVPNNKLEESLSEKEAAPTKKRSSVQNGSDKEEAKYAQSVAKPESAMPASEKEAKRKELNQGEKKVKGAEKEALQDNEAAAPSKPTITEKLKAKEAESFDDLKTLNDGKINKEETAKTKDDRPLVAPVVAVEKGMSYEYVANFKFNQKEFSKKIISSRNLSDNSKAQKLSLQEVIEMTGIKTPVEQQNFKGKPAVSEKITINDIPIAKKEAKRAEEKSSEEKQMVESKREAASAVEKEEKTELNSALANELALVYQCLLSYNDRAKLSIDAKKALLENIKKTLKNLSHIEHDDLLNQWLEKIDKE